MASTVRPLSWFEKRAFLRARVRVDPWDAEQFEALVEEQFPHDAELRAGLVEMVRKRIAADWRFIMLDPVLFYEVGEFLRRGPAQAKSWRPRLAERLWRLLPTQVCLDDGTLAASRDELAAMLSEEGARVRPDHVSEVMKALEGINAARSWKEGRKVRWALNPVLATHGDEERRAYWQAKAGPILIADGGKLVRDPKPFTDPAQLVLFPDG